MPPRQNSNISGPPQQAEKILIENVNISKLKCEHFQVKVQGHLHI